MRKIKRYRERRHGESEGAVHGERREGEMADPEVLFCNCTKVSHGIEYHDVESTGRWQRLRGFCLSRSVLLSGNMRGMSVLCCQLIKYV